MVHYYDTIVFSYFFYNPKVKNRFSPIDNAQITPAISFFSIEEFLHTNFKLNASNWGNPKKYYELWEELELFRPFFETINDIKMEDLNTNFSKMISRIINHANQKGLDYNTLYSEHRIPEMMDIVHLIIADMAGASFFITADGKFAFFEDITDLPLKNVTEVIILDRNNFEEKERKVYLNHSP